MATGRDVRFRPFCDAGRGVVVVRLSLWYRACRRSRPRPDRVGRRRAGRPGRPHAHPLGGGPGRFPAVRARLPQRLGTGVPRDPAHPGRRLTRRLPRHLRRPGRQLRVQGRAQRLLGRELRLRRCARRREHPADRHRRTRSPSPTTTRPTSSPTTLPEEAGQRARRPLAAHRRHRVGGTRRRGDVPAAHGPGRRPGHRRRADRRDRRTRSRRLPVGSTPTSRRRTRTSRPSTPSTSRPRRSTTPARC